MPVGVNPGRLPGFSDEHRAHVIGFSDTGICFESQHRSKMSDL
jgi:hypothetical protein